MYFLVVLVLFVFVYLLCSSLVDLKFVVEVFNNLWLDFYLWFQDFFGFCEWKQVVDRIFKLVVVYIFFFRFSYMGILVLVIIF